MPIYRFASLATQEHSKLLGFVNFKQKQLLFSQTRLTQFANRAITVHVSPWNGTMEWESHSIHPFKNKNGLIGEEAESVELFPNSEITVTH